MKIHPIKGRHTNLDKLQYFSFGHCRELPYVILTSSDELARCQPQLRNIVGLTRTSSGIFQAHHWIDSTSSSLDPGSWIQDSFLNKKTFPRVQQEDIPSCWTCNIIVRQEDMSSCSTRRHVFVLSRIEQEDTCSGPTRKHVFMFNKKTHLLVQ